MKTAMQELIDTYASFDTLDQFNDWLCNNEQRLLEKEKEQIIDAYKSGVKLIAGDIEDASKHYYNQTYNKND